MHACVRVHVHMCMHACVRVHACVYVCVYPIQGSVCGQGL